MKILFVTDLYPIEKGETTTPLTLHNFVKEWIKLGHEVDVIKPNFLLNSFLREKKFYETGFYKFDDINILNINYFSPFWFDISKKIPENIDLKSYDAIIAHMPSGIIFANRLLNETGIYVPLICGIHCSDIEVLTNPIYGFYFKKQLKDAYKRAKKIACRSHVLQKRFSKLMPDCAEKTFVAPSGFVTKCKVQSAKYNCEKSCLQDNETIKKTTVLTCANLIKRKNIDKLVLAVKDLSIFELKIIGDGKELKHLKKNASSNVNFLGRLPHEKVIEKMEKSDIFILPSVNETFGMVYLEAMASGCVTVCTKNDGIDGIIKDGENGFLTGPTVEGIKETLLRIKDYDLEKIIQNSLETVKEYTPEICAKNYLDNINT